MHSSYQSTVLRGLRDQQVRYAPIERKIIQAKRAEDLLREVKPNKVYPYEFVFHKITDFRPDLKPTKKIKKIPGSELFHDLLLFIEDVTDSANIPVEDIEGKVYSTSEACKLLSISKKTINRWRRDGLVSWKVLYGARKRVVFREDSIKGFQKHNQNRVARGKQFSQITEEEREQILFRARRLARAGGSAREISKRIASRYDRCTATIRSILREFDQANPSLSLFPEATVTLTDEHRLEICDLYNHGVSVDELTSQFNRTKTSIYRIIGLERYRELIELNFDFIDSDEFRRPYAAKKILAGLPEADGKGKKTKKPADLPAYLGSLYETPLLSQEQEKHLFRKMNFLLYRADKVRNQLNPKRPTRVLMKKIDTDYQEAIATKNQITRANLRLVVSIAKRHVRPESNFFELISDGNVSLIRAVERFDYSRGNKFSTYATWTLIKNFARSIPSEQKIRSLFRTSSDDMFSSTPEEGTSQFEQELMQERNAHMIKKIIDVLSEREQKIIISRFGLDRARKQQTLREVGDKLGLTRERVRQLEIRALEKLRETAEERKIELSL